MLTRKNFLFPAALAVIACGASSWTLAAEAEEAPASSMSNMQVAAEQDKGFVVKASQAGHQEVADAKMAQRKSTRSDVKQVAAMLERDHMQAGAKLNAIVAQKHWNIPEAKTLAKGAPNDATYSDDAYITNQISSHEEAIALFKKEASEGQSQDLKAFAGEILPKLQLHLSAIQALQKS